MKRRLSLPLAALAALAAVLSWWSWSAQAQAPRPMQWIWYNEGDPLREAPAETRFFRRVFTLDAPVANATLEVTADNAFTLWVNGAEVGSGSEWQRLERFTVKQLRKGKNVLAVEARNEGGPAGVIVRLSYGPRGKRKQILVSDDRWKSAKSAPEGWQKVDFDDGKWIAARALGDYGKVGPWGNVAAARGPAGPRRFTVPEGFRVERAVQAPERDRNFSLVNMTFDNRGRLLVSREGGAVLICTRPDRDGVLQDVRPYCTQVKNCQGMCWVQDALLLVGDGPQGTGLYRCRDTQGKDRIDEVKLLHRFVGGMGEHGPHAVLHGPDGFLYVVIGNHSWARVDRLASNSPLTRWPTGQQGPDLGKPDTTEDVLLPRQNDANGHAANLHAPGGTIWRLDRDGKNVSLVAAGFRNEFDAAFSPAGELFTFDSDMEWDVGLPWYRPVRVCHCPPGAEFGWRTGSSKIPPYALDTLPAVYDTGRGSPVGVEFYDHFAFPEKYRGAFFMADWSLGIIYAVHLKRDGASYKAEAEKFCTGSPMNVTDLAVAPDGSVYFTLGGRGTQGGVYRIVHEGKGKRDDNLGVPQPLAAWSREAWGTKLNQREVQKAFLDAAQSTSLPARTRVKALTRLQAAHKLHPRDLLPLTWDKQADVRAHAVWLLGVNGFKEGRDALVGAIKDEDAMVRRRACEALVRAGIEPPVDSVWPLLRDSDRFVHTAARLVLQRIDPDNWAARIAREESDLAAWNAILALCKVNKARPHAAVIFARLARGTPAEPGALVDYLRTLQMALIHADAKPKEGTSIARRLLGLFPHKDYRVSRELAILLTHFRREEQTDADVHGKLLAALLADKDDRKQQIHYFYCLRLLHDGWTEQQKKQLLAWYDSTKTWSGGASFTPFLANILRDAAPVFSPADVARLVAEGERYPLATTTLLKVASEKQLPSLDVLGDLYVRLTKRGAGAQTAALKGAIIATLGRKTSPEAQAALRKVADSDPAQGDAVARSLARFPTKENFPYLLGALASPNKVVVFDAIEALAKDPAKPKADDPAPYRAVLLASRKLDERNRWKAVRLLRHWGNNKQFGAEEGEWKAELAAWSKWFAQSFPKEPALPDVAGEQPTESKYKFAELRDYLEKGEGRKGDVTRGRVVFEKAQCLKCHKYGKEGEGIGPDLTTLSKRFKRADVLESILYPSRVISDQYRSTMVVTKKGQQINGLAATQGDTVTVIQSDGSRVTLKKDEIDQQFTSLVSVMPERLLDPLSKREIADLFAFLESEPAK